MSPLRAVTPREASIFACLVDAYVEPEPPFPPVARTAAVTFFDAWAAEAPAANRLGLRALLYGCELAPLLSGRRRRFRRLQAVERTAFLRALEASRAIPLRLASKLVRVATTLAYYGDPAVMRACGYDPEDKIARSRALRKREGRP